MKYLLMAAALCTACQANAQITLEHTYAGAENMSILKMEGYGYKYLENRTDHVLRMYNMDHTVWKTIDYNSLVPADQYTWPQNVSTKLFDLDDEIEFCIEYQHPGGGLDKTYMIVNEDGSILKQFDHVFVLAVWGYDEGTKLLAYKYEDNKRAVDVYSLPGKTSLKPSEKIADVNLYPNPMETAATLRYVLPTGMEQATINIYNSNGSKVKEMTVTSRFSEVLIQRGSLAAGNYFYEIVAPGIKPVSQKFVVQ